MSEDDDIRFIDADEQWGQTEGISIREIVLRHLNKISEITTGEFKEGYWQKKPVNVGGGVYIAETYIEDKRDAYINAIDFLHDLLLPYFDEEMTEIAKELEEDLDDTLKESQEKNGSPKAWIDYKLKNKRKLLQQMSLLLKRKNYLELGAIVQ